MSSIDLAQTSEKIVSSRDLKKELTIINGQLVGKYTWLQIENKNLFLKITNVLEIRKATEITWDEFYEKESRRCGTINYKEEVLVVFDFRKTFIPNSDDTMKSDRVLILKVDRYKNTFLIGILFNEIDEIVF